MTVRYGYDLENGHLFSWDGEFHYYKNAKPDENGIIVTNRQMATLVGCGFLSGFSHLKCVWIDENERFEIGMILGKGKKLILFKIKDEISALALCGPAIKNSEIIAQECKKVNPIVSVYVCPLIEELAAFGVLASNLLIDNLEHPRRANLYSYREDDDEVENWQKKDFDLKLGTDAIGRMAHLLSVNVPVKNEIMNVVGLSYFYNCVLSVVPIPNCVAIVRCDAIHLVPKMTHSMRTAATSVPVMTEVSGELQEAVQQPYFPVLLASDYIPEITTFMNFFHLCSRGKSFIFSSRGTLRDGPAFRYNAGYRRKSDETL